MSKLPVLNFMNIIIIQYLKQGLLHMDKIALSLTIPSAHICAVAEGDCKEKKKNLSNQTEILKTVRIEVVIYSEILIIFI